MLNMRRFNSNHNKLHRFQFSIRRRLNKFKLKTCIVTTMITYKSSSYKVNWQIARTKIFNWINRSPILHNKQTTCRIKMMN